MQLRNVMKNDVFFLFKKQKSNKNNVNDLLLEVEKAAVNCAQ